MTVPYVPGKGQLPRTRHLEAPCTACATANATAALAAGEPLKVVSERLGHASTSITANLYQHVLPSMDERTANAVARLILGERKPDFASSAVNPLSTGPGVHEAQEGGDARTSSSGGVSEGGLEPARPYRALGPQPPKSRSPESLRLYSCCSDHREQPGMAA